MIIDKILFVSDNNINYLSFWPSISRFYQTHYNIIPHLFFLGIKDDLNKKYLDQEYGTVTVVQPLPNIPIIIQSLWGKFWFTQTEPSTNWLIGDIDLYLLNKKYLHDCLSSIPSNAYAHLNANGYKLGNWWENPKTGIPGYWHLASGSLFKEYLQLSDSFEEDCAYIYSSKKYGILYNGLINQESNAPERVKDKQNYGYICCEEHLSTERLSLIKDRIHGFTYPTSLPRLETHFSEYGKSTPCDFNLWKWYINSKDINFNIKHIDFHAPRPYSCFGEDIEKIIQDAVY